MKLSLQIFVVILVCYVVVIAMRCPTLPIRWLEIVTRYHCNCFNFTVFCSRQTERQTDTIKNIHQLQTTTTSKNYYYLKKTRWKLSIVDKVRVSVRFRFNVQMSSYRDFKKFAVGELTSPRVYQWQSPTWLAVSLFATKSWSIKLRTDRHADKTTVSVLSQKCAILVHIYCKCCCT